MSSLAQFNLKFESLLQRLPQGWEEMAVEHHAFTRSRQIKSPRELLRAVFAYAVADYSLRSVAALLTEEQTWISDQGVHARLANCGAWLETLLAQLLCQKATQISVQTGRSLKIVDATILTCPAARGTDYRLHLCYEPLKQASCGVKLTDVKGAERFTHFAYEPLDIVLGDRIYGKAKHIIKVKEQGADVLVRQSLQQLRLYTEMGQVIEWQELLIKAQAVGRLLLEAYIRDAEGGQAKVYVICQRLSAAEIESARRQVKRSASDKGHKTRAATLLACEWLTVLTTIGPEEMSAEMILQMYRVRWQIELYIKRLKSILKLGQLRASRGSELARVHLLAKMIYALLVETISVERFGNHWTQMTRKRRGTWFRVWRMIDCTRCFLDGFAIGCEQAASMMDVGAAIPAQLAAFQNRPGFIFQSVGLGLYRYYIPNTATLGDQIPNNNGEDGDVVRVNTDVPQGRWGTAFFGHGITQQNRIPTLEDLKSGKVKYTEEMIRCDNDLGELFGDDGAYMAANSFDLTQNDGNTGSPPQYRGDYSFNGRVFVGHLSNYAAHLYASTEGGSTATTNVYAPAGGVNPATGGRNTPLRIDEYRKPGSVKPGIENTADLLYYSQLGNLRNVTLLIVHVNRVRPVVSGGRILLGTTGGPGGDTPGGTPHAHFELLPGRVRVFRSQRTRIPFNRLCP
jgi:hypothetical protein